MFVSNCLNRIHITPEDYIAKFKDWDGDSACYVLYYIPPSGCLESNEVSDTIYSAGDTVQYHVHERGMELFLIDRGSVECWINGKRAVAEKGDMILITPHLCHGFRFLEDNTIWRETFQEIHMNDGILALNRVREFHPETLKDPEFFKFLMKREAGVFFDYEPELEDVPKSMISAIRPYDYSLERFDADGISLLQKASRLECSGHKEIWQLRLRKGVKLSWNEWNPHTNLFIVYSGSAEVKTDGGLSFTAKERDILHIPNHLAGEITAAEDMVLLDYNCRGYPLNALGEAKSCGLLKNKDRKALDEVFIKNDYFLSWEW